MRVRWLGLAGLAALASGCAADLGGGPGTVGARPTAASVTRFHLGPAIARGEIAVEPLDPARARDPAFARTAAAVEAQLQALGWTVVRGGARSEQVALVQVEQEAREQLRRRSGLSIGLGIGGGSFGRHGGVGVGAGASVPVTGGWRRGQVVTTQLAVRLQRRSDRAALWEGRAQDEVRSDSPAADPGAAAARLAPLLFGGFPGESGRTIRVR